MCQTHLELDFNIWVRVEAHYQSNSNDLSQKMQSCQGIIILRAVQGSGFLEL